MRSTEPEVIELNAAFYEFTQEVQGAIFQAMGAVRARSTEPFPAPPPILQLRGGYAESPAWFLVQAMEFDPEPLSVAALRVRDIYASEGIVGALLEIMASEKWLDRREKGEYHLTEQGRAAMGRIRGRQKQFMAGLTAVPDLSGGEVGELEGLLGRVIEACLARSQGEGAWCLAHSRNRAPGVDAVGLDRIRQYLEDLNAFRDDAHMAAWGQYCGEGYVWEAFSFVCDGQAGTADELFEALCHRGYSRGDYGEALRLLGHEGYVDRDGIEGRYGVSDKGREMRGVVERVTDEYFYGPWDVLSGEEKLRLISLMRGLRDKLERFVASE